MFKTRISSTIRRKTDAGPSYPSERPSHSAAHSGSAIRSASPRVSGSQSEQHLHGAANVGLCGVGFREDQVTATSSEVVSSVMCSLQCHSACKRWYVWRRTQSTSGRSISRQRPAVPSAYCNAIALANVGLYGVGLRVYQVAASVGSDQQFHWLIAMT